MAEAQATFSEHWHRIAGQRVWLLPNVRVRRQFFRGERWHVLEHPFANRFFRLRPAAYAFIARLGPDRTVQQAWEDCLQRHPDEAPGQEAAIQLLSQLYLANLIHYPAAGDSAQLFERFEKRRQREIRSTLLNVMFMKFPLLDPDNFLNRTAAWARPFLSWFGVILWVAMVATGVKFAVDHASELQLQSQGILAPDNLPLLYACLVVLKSIHEFGHAYACKLLGGEVHTMGVMLMIFTPVPFVDATASWGFRSRWHRLLVGAAGMIVELFVAAIAAVIWSHSAPGVVHSLCYNLMFIASVSTLVFNLNPLLRFDGYYMLSDLLEIPNLHQRATAQLRYLAERYLFGFMKGEPPSSSVTERRWLTVFGLLSYAYRIVVFSGILFVVADQFLILGILMALAGVVSWVLVPAGRFIHYLATSPRLERIRPRAIGVSAGIALVLIAVLGVIPFPSHIRAPGVVQTQRRTELATQVDGRIVRLLARTGARVEAGAPLLEMTNRELELRIAQAAAQRDETQARLLQAQQVETANLKPLRQRLETVEQLLADLGRDRSNLVVRAAHAGIWAAPGVEDFVGRWVRRGTDLGLIVDPSRFEFTAVVSQGDGDALFGRPIRKAEVRVKGQSERLLTVESWKAVPGEQFQLPSAALGWVGGGTVAVASDDPHGRKATDPFFQVDTLLNAPPQGLLFHGRTGVLRLTLEPEPLLQRWVRRFLQLVQKRYTI
jgi:putative peptide zinc metalloprotease protein